MTRRNPYYLIIICVFFLALCFTPIVNAVELNITDSYEQGYTQKNPLGRSINATVLMGGRTAGGILLRGYLEFNITSLSNSSIIRAGLYYDGVVHNGAVNLTVPAIRPSTSGDEATFDAIGNGTLIASEATFPIVGNQQFIEFNSAGVLSLINAVDASQVYWAVGLVGDQVPAADTRGLINDWSAGAATPIPTLWIKFGLPPNKPTLNDPGNSSVFVPSSVQTFNWTFSDNDVGDTQGAFRLQIDNDPAFGSTYLDTGKNSTAVSIYVSTLPVTDDLWYWRVKTWDNYNLEGPWSNLNTFNTSTPSTVLQSLSTSDSRVGINVNVNINANITFANGTAFVTPPVFIQGVNASSLGNGTWRISINKTIPGIYNFTSVQTIYNNLTGLSTVTWDLFNIAVGVLYSQVEATLNTLIYANGSSVVDGHELTQGDTVTINGIPLGWNRYLERFEQTVSRNIPTIEAFNVLTAFNEATYSIGAGNITSYPTVTWTTQRIDQVMPFMRRGDWPGAIIQMNIILIGETMFWTFILMAISVGVYNYSGPEVVVLIWMFGWSMFGTVIGGQALTISLIMMALAGGIYIAKFFLDRRTTV